MQRFDRHVQSECVVVQPRPLRARNRRSLGEKNVGESLARAVETCLALQTRARMLEHHVIMRHDLLP